MSLSRELQHTLLQRLCDAYPDAIDVQKWETDLPGTTVNLAYLAEHGLCKVDFSQAISQVRVKPIRAKATAKGMDFLADDGGLSAILGVVTIKLHDGTIKALLESKILESDLPQPEKQRYLDQLRKLPAETTKHLVLKLVDLGLEKGSKAIEMIGTLLTNNPTLG